MTRDDVTTGLLRIGAMAAASGVSVQALRYYERRGLIPAPRRRRSGYREYEPATVERVRFIRQAQEMGFRLEEVATLLRLRATVERVDPRQGDDAVRRAIVGKLADVDRRIGHLTGIRETLVSLLDACDRMCAPGTPPAECPIFDAFDHPAAPGSIAPAPRTPRAGRRARSGRPQPS